MTASFLLLRLLAPPFTVPVAQPSLPRRVCIPARLGRLRRLGRLGGEESKFRLFSSGEEHGHERDCGSDDEAGPTGRREIPAASKPLELELDLEEEEEAENNGADHPCDIEAERLPNEEAHEQDHDGCRCEDEEVDVGAIVELPEVAGLFLERRLEDGHDYKQDADYRDYAPKETDR